MKKPKKPDQNNIIHCVESIYLTNKIVHTNPANSCKIVIIDTNNGTILSNNHKKTIINKSLDRREILRQISHDENISTSTYREGLILLPPGCTYTHDTHDNSSNIKISLCNQVNYHPGKADDPFEILVSHIAAEYRNNNCGKLVVRFSGGVDSTCLLLAAIEVAGASRVTALTWFADDCSSNNDRIAATSLCKTLNIKHMLFRFEPRYLFQDIDPDNHYFVNLGMASDQVFEKEGDFISSHLDEDYIILDGHGGDHVFLDPVPSQAFRDLFKRKNIINGLKIAVKISKLTGSSIYETLSSNRKQRNHQYNQRNDFLNIQVPPLLNIGRPENLRDVHLQATMQAMAQNATSTTLNKTTKIAYPFTSKEMVEFALNQNPYNMFNEFATRLPLRYATNKKYPTIPLRSDKGHITSAYQRALKHHKERILNKLTKSWLTKDNLINMSHVENAISRSALGIGGVDPILLKIICASLIKGL
ncbi:MULTISPECIES: asparagine synthase-related protein [Pseudomonas]|uniref:Asparagine synthase-related protein n=1 Tax=Pseudomonas aphyarum TaxID=2942629 RepID=A0ABT5PGY3_9PSED|nr:asparagine synthase-related protein [Pseudomonas aphyarum]MDD0967827.1 asparagine synthase-related protein [Pseudomonas aphyarum]MDD1123138.1 asparagine synthase-related protein [Pseudomonas aphyarum]